MLLSSLSENLIPIRTSEIRFLFQTSDNIFFILLVQDNVPCLTTKQCDSNYGYNVSLDWIGSKHWSVGSGRTTWLDFYRKPFKISGRGGMPQEQFYNYWFLQNTFISKKEIFSPILLLIKSSFDTRNSSMLYSYVCSHDQCKPGSFNIENVEYVTLSWSSSIYFLTNTYKHIIERNAKEITILTSPFPHPLVK